MKLLDYSRFKRGKRAAPGSSEHGPLLISDLLQDSQYRGTVSQTDEPLQASGVAQVNKNLLKNSFR
ncbi:uncharacterized protein LOC144859581 isoform X2 [Branchiostoma floridae x Branchiostoma japonicum]